MKKGSRNSFVQRSLLLGLIFMILAFNQRSNAQPGCGNIAINIQDWRSAGETVKVKIRLLPHRKKLRSFKVSAADSVFTFEHSDGSIYCRLKSGHKVLKLVIDSLSCIEQYHFNMSDSHARTVILIPKETHYESGISHPKSILLVERKENL
ncbi:MAG: hypothetical protein GC181_10155 [Bacteroidetes bacterium]|nr:hypothetical protein [Bacteroidota bacterium]